jgi:hypothetical protein
VSRNRLRAAGECRRSGAYRVRSANNATNNSTGQFDDRLSGYLCRG